MSFKPFQFSSFSSRRNIVYSSIHIRIRIRTGVFEFIIICDECGWNDCECVNVKLPFQDVSELVWEQSSVALNYNKKGVENRFNSTDRFSVARHIITEGRAENTQIIYDLNHTHCLDTHFSSQF